MNAAIFLDKDGTLIEDVPYNVDPRKMVLAPHAVAGLRLFRRLGYRLLAVSNQPGLALGRFDEAGLAQAWRQLDHLLQEQGARLDGHYCCPHHPDGAISAYARACHCRKPQPGMLRRAAFEHGLDLAACWMVGDILDDVEAGRRAGCKTILIDNGNETEWKRSPLRNPDLVAPDLHAAALAAARYGLACAHRPWPGARDD
jgi:D-glycero-D-manno-heptose 1,7-bisphosphate phosphatase